MSKGSYRWIKRTMTENEFKSDVSGVQTVCRRIDRCSLYNVRDPLVPNKQRMSRKVEVLDQRIVDLVKGVERRSGLERLGSSWSLIELGLVNFR